MNEVRCTKCNKKLGESPNDVKLDSASCEKDKIIYKTRCPRCNTDIIIVFEYDA
jgi:phage FluMu protein Com